MVLSKWAYHADFVVYPVLVTAAVLHSDWRAGQNGWHWALAAIAGLVAWSVIEYAIHRWVLHQVPPFNRLHALHHAQPVALIGTPTWLSAALFLGLWWVMDYTLPAGLGDGLAAGMMTGYLGYALIHDAVHHRLARRDSWLHRAKLRHARHHQSGTHCNYGVSSGLWDTVFGTAASPQRSAWRRWYEARVARRPR